MILFNGLIEMNFTIMNFLYFFKNNYQIILDIFLNLFLFEFPQLGFCYYSVKTLRKISVIIKDSFSFENDSKEDKIFSSINSFNKIIKICNDESRNTKKKLNKLL